MEIGLYTFADVAPGQHPGQRLRNLVEEIVLADQVGLDIFGVGEHHRPDYAVSAPTVALAAAATQTKRIRLSSVSGTGDAEGTLRIEGDAAYSGEVCVLRVAYTGTPPIPVDRLRATPAGTCVKVAADGDARLPFRVVVASEGDGRVNGRLLLRVTGVNGRTFDTGVPFAFSILGPVDEGARNLLFVVLLLLGIAALASAVVNGLSGSVQRHLLGKRFIERKIHDYRMLLDLEQPPLADWAGLPLVLRRLTGVVDKLSDLSGRSLMIHAAGDNYSDDPKPLGGGGARIACGVIP